jgi:hypothetical protein
MLGTPGRTPRYKIALLAWLGACPVITDEFEPMTESLSAAHYFHRR